jgi:hypothetical protein
MNHFVRVIAVSQNQANETSLFAGTDGGVFLSTDNGGSWVAVNTGLTNPNVRTIAVSPSVGGGTNVIAGTWGGGVFLSTDNGTNWAVINTGLTNTDVFALAVSSDAASGTNLFAGTLGGGVFLSTNTGTAWTAVNTNLADLYVQALAVSQNGAATANLFAGTASQGVWRRPLSEMVTSATTYSTDLPAQVSLEQNYPNPFNPATTISFRLPSTSFVSLAVFDALGKQVRVLLAKELPAGTYASHWDATGLASGLYFYRLQAGSTIETKKLVLLK